MKMYSVTGTSDSMIHSVSIRLTETQKAVITHRMPAMFKSMALPQKSSFLRFAERPCWASKYQPNARIMPPTKTSANYERNMRVG